MEIEYVQKPYNTISNHFDKTREYSRIRVYAFLAERFLSYWFKKNSNYIVWPLKFHDISNDKINF